MGERILPRLHEYAFRHPKCREEVKEAIKEIAEKTKRPSGAREISKRPDDLSRMMRSRALDVAERKAVRRV